MTELQQKIISMVNGACFSKTDVMLTRFSEPFVFKKNLRKICSEYSPKPVIAAGTIQKISIEKYTGRHPVLNNLILDLQKIPTQFLVGVYLHGSTGSDEMISYSDLDALVVIDDEVMSNIDDACTLLSKLNKCRKWMYRLDPLQHHGWFLLLKSQLKNYPQIYFPHELFKHAKALGNFSATTLEISFDNSSIDYKAPFNKLSESLIKRIEGGYRPTQLYPFKNLLSEIMLLPAFYCQARDRKGVFKKFSFELAQKDFTVEDWNAVATASRIRKIWRQDNLETWMLNHKAWYRSKIKKLSDNISKEVKENADENFYKEVVHLSKLMQEKLK